MPPRRLTLNRRRNLSTLKNMIRERKRLGVMSTGTSGSVADRYRAIAGQASASKKTIEALFAQIDRVIVVRMSSADGKITKSRAAALDKRIKLVKEQQQVLGKAMRRISALLGEDARAAEVVPRVLETQKKAVSAFVDSTIQEINEIAADVCEVRKIDDPVAGAAQANRPRAPIDTSFFQLYRHHRTADTSRMFKKSGRGGRKR